LTTLTNPDNDSSSSSSDNSSGGDLFIPVVVVVFVVLFGHPKESFPISTKSSLASKRLLSLTFSNFCRWGRENL